MIFIKVENFSILRRKFVTNFSPETLFPIRIINKLFRFVFEFYSYQATSLELCDDIINVDDIPQPESSATVCKYIVSVRTCFAWVASNEPDQYGSSCFCNISTVSVVFLWRRYRALTRSTFFVSLSLLPTLSVFQTIYCYRCFPLGNRRGVILRTVNRKYKSEKKQNRREKINDGNLGLEQKMECLL